MIKKLPYFDSLIDQIMFVVLEDLTYTDVGTTLLNITNEVYSDLDTASEWFNVMNRTIMESDYPTESKAKAFRIVGEVMKGFEFTEGVQQ